MKAAKAPSRPPKQRLVTRIPSSVRPYLRSLRFAVNKAGAAVVRPAIKYVPGTSRDFGPPRGFARSLKEYAERRSGLASYTELYPEHRVIRTLPIVAHQSGTVRPEFMQEQVGTYPAAGVGVIDGGRVLTDRGTVIAPPDEFIADVSDAWTNGDQIIYPIFLSPRFPRVVKTDETVAVVSSHCSWWNYGHWLGDTLPRLHLLEKSGVHYDKIVVPYLFSFQREALELLGIDRAKMIVDTTLHIEARRLVVPTFPGLYGLPPRWACEYLRERFLPHVKPSTKPRRIFISRNKPGATRRILNEDVLYEALRPFGLERLFPEELSFAEEVSLFNNAEVIVGPVGAGMVNLLWCKPGTAVIEIFSPRYVNVMNWMFANHADLNYACSLGEGRGALINDGDQGQYEDITANVDEVVQLLQTLCAKAGLAAR